MRKTLNINLGGMAFTIDENAFELLHNYLEALRRKFGNEAEREEILNDIEGRIAEMFSQKLAGRKEVVSLEDVQTVMDAMGKPEDIAGDEPEGETTTTASATGSATGPAAAPVKKRLYRDPDDAKVGGVISGLCHYFGINDPTWARIAALILIFFTSGSVILLYFLLLIVVPKANTAAEKLQMKGEPININTIEKEIKDAANRMGESVHKLTGDQNFFEKLWGIVVALFSVVIKLVAILVIFIAAISLVSVVVAFFAFYILGTTPFNAASHLLVDSAGTITVFSFGFLLFLGALILMAIYWGLRILIGPRSNAKWVGTGLGVLSIVGLVLLIISGYSIARNFKEGGVVNHTSVLMQPSQQSLYVQLVDSNGNKLRPDDDDEAISGFNIDDDGVFINGTNIAELDKIPLGKPSLELMASENDSFYIQEVIKSQGRNKADAEKNANLVIYSFAQTDSLLNLRSHIYLDKNGKYRAQRLKIRIAIPEGKQVRFANNIDELVATVKGNSDYDDTYFNNTTWTVEKGKVKCIVGENHKNSDEEDRADRLEKKMKKLEEKLNNDADKSKRKIEHHDKDEDKDDKDQDF